MLIAIVLRGMNSYLIKYVAYYNYSSTVFFTYTHLIAVFIALCFVDFSTFFDLRTVIIGLLGGSLFFINAKLLFNLLKHLSSSFTFVNTRILTTIGIFLVGALFFGENITILQFIGVFLGILVFILLYDKSDKAQKNANFKLGLYLFFIYVVMMILANTFNKLGANESVFNYAFYALLSAAVLFTVEAYVKKIPKKEFFNFKDKKVRFLFMLGICNAFFLAVNNIFYYLALNLKEFVVVYKMYSFEIFIPIILSYLFLNEKMNTRKIIALVLTVFSIIFLI